MLYPVGWLAPELPTPSSLGPEVFSTSPSPQPSLSPPPSLGQRPQIHGPSLTEDGPRWAMGSPSLGSRRHHKVAMTPAVAPGLAGNIDLAAPAAPTQTEMLRQGSHGDAVWVLQARLQRLGYDPGPLDGHFGPQTERAVRQFQQASHLAVDGVVGVITWRYLVPGRALPSALDSPPATTPTLSTDGTTSVLPPAAGALSTYFSLHPMVVLPEGSPSQLLGIVVIGLGLAGLVTHLGLRPDASLRPRWSSAAVPPSSPVHAPQPIYPPSQPPSPLTRWPTPLTSTQSTPNPSTSTPSTPNSSTPNPSTLAPSTSTPSTPNPSTLTASTPTHLPNFVYDLLQPYGRHQLEALLTGTATTEERPQNPPMLAALLQRVGVFPERNYRTGATYTYLLLDDVGGGFRLCGNELWLTHLAHHWFQPDVAYTALIRRIDTAGQVLDKEFTVALSRQQLAWVA